MTSQSRLRILHLEDDDLDAELAAAVFEEARVQVDIHRVKSQQGFAAALASPQFDVILSDYNIPGFDGRGAFELARRMSPDTPFLFVSGALGEEVAVERLKDGVTDVVSKDRISRLPLAVDRARREAIDRRDRQAAEEALRRLHDDLEHRVAMRTAELEAANGLMRQQQGDLDKTRRELQAILDHSPWPIFVTDVGDRFLIVNHAAARVIGTPPDQVIGRRVADVFPPKFAAEVNAHTQEVVTEGRPKKYEESVPAADGTKVFSVSRFPMIGPAGRIVAVGGIASDVTEQKRAEQAIQEARAEADRANRAKSEFLSRMSHELRTPLNSILGFAQLFEPESLTSDQQENVRHIMAGGRHLLGLINEVIDISRVETGALALSPEAVDVNETVAAAVALIDPLAAQRGIRVIVDPTPGPHSCVRADRQRLTQVLLNLLSNAVKYNRPDGTITVTVDAPTAGWLRIAVADTGPGIAPELLPWLFEPFHRLGAERTAVEGTGLGLALSKALCVAMGGHLNVDSVVDAGTTFSIELAADPDARQLVAPVPAEAKIAAAATTISAREAVIVYIEDNPANVRLMERVVARRPGLTLLHAPDGQLGIAMVQQRRPGLVLLDLQLPGMPGDEVLRQLRAELSTRTIPVVILTADATPELAERLLSAGATRCLTKPFDVPTVLRTFEELLASSTGSNHA